MAKTKKKEIQKQGLRPSQKAKAEKLRKKQEAKIKAEQEPTFVQESISETSNVQTVVQNSQATDNTNSTDNLSAVKVINVKNAEGEQDTKTPVGIPVIFITDDNYVVPTSVAITSLICNKRKETKYDIFLLTTGLSEENKLLFSQFNTEDITLTTKTIPLDELENLHTYENDTICQASPAALLKFKIPTIFTQYDKVIYLDGDILVNGDLTKLYSTDVSGYYVAAVHDTGKLYHNKEIYKEIPLYFNSGVMLLNLDKCRKEDATNKLIEAKRKSTDNTLMDQNVLNIVFQDAVKIVDIKYNFLILNLTRASNKYTMDGLNALFNTKYQNLDSISQKACVLHFSSKDKPWKYTDGYYSKEWYDYFLKSPHKNTPIVRSKFVKSEFNQTQRKALIIELNPCHGECVPGYAKYFVDLGYDLHVILNEELENDSPLSGVFEHSRIELKYMPQADIIKYIQNTEELNQYSVCLFNSDYIYKYEKSVVYLLSPTKYDVKILTVSHRQELINSKIQTRSNVVVLKKFDDNDSIYEVNPHYFGKYTGHEKNKVTEFVVVGGIDSRRKNYTLLVDALTDLIEKKKTNFKVTVVGKGNIDNLPESIQKHITLTGRLTFPQMYEVLKNADFFLPLLDYNNKDHLRYCTTGTSGSFQLIYGFNLPCIIDKNFAEKYDLTSTECLPYNENEFATAMAKAIDMKNDEYEALLQGLSLKVQTIYHKSLEQIRDAIEKNYKKEPFPIKTYVLLPYYLIKNIYLKHKKDATILSKVTKLLQNSRIDIKNFGTADNAVEVISDTGTVSTPKYLTSDQGIGQEVNCKADRETIKIKIKNDGKLVIRFRGISKQYNGVRFPIWTDYKSIKIDDKELLSFPIATWHDEPFTYEIPVKDRQEIEIKVIFCNHQYTKDELETTLQKLVQYKGYISDNIEDVLRVAEKKYILAKNEVVTTLPQIVSDVFISVGYNCQVAQHLRTFNLRYTSLPFDWLTDYDLHIVTKTIKDGFNDWFIKYKENKSSNHFREIVDLNTGVKCPHFFPKDKSVEEYLSIFKEKFSERNERFIQILKQSNNVCFVSQRQDNLPSLMYFLQKISAMFSNLHITMINLHNTVNDNKTLCCTTIDGKIKLYNIYADNSPDTDKSWMGNTKLWAKIANNLKLSNMIRSIQLNNDKTITNNKLKMQTSTIDVSTKQKKDLEQKIKDFSSSLLSYRLDIKNFGTENNAIKISSATGKLDEPKWYTNSQGIGKVLSGNSMNNIIKIKIIKAGMFHISFRGQNKSFNGKRIPVWVDYKSIKIDGKEILSSPIATWHDKPFKYDMPVRDGQEITIEFEQQCHQYTEDELKEVLSKLYINNAILEGDVMKLLSDRFCEKMDVVV